MAVFTETIKLDDQVSGPAKSAAGAVSSAGKVMGGLSKSTFDAANAMKVGKEVIGGAIAGIRSAFTSLAAGDVKGAIQGVTDTVASLAKLLDLVVPGLGQAVAAVIQIAGGLVGITAGLIKSGVEFAIASSQAKQQMLTMFDALGEGKITGEQVDDMLDGLSAKLGQTKDAMIPLVQKFAAMGITSQEALEKMTTAALSAKALSGGAESGAQAFEKLSKKIQLASETGNGLKIPIKGLGSLADMGLTVDDVAKKMGMSAKVLAGQLKDGTANAGKFGDAMQSALIEKGAGPLEKMGLSSKNLGSMLQQYIGDMFEDLSSSVDPFMKEIKSLFGIFQKDAPSAKAMTAGIRGVLQQVFAVLTRVVPLAKHFLLDMVIYGLKAYLAIKPIVGEVKKFAASAKGASMIASVLSALWTVLKVVGAAFLVVAVAIGAAWLISVALAATIWVVIGALLSLAYDAFSATTGAVLGLGATIVDFVSNAITALIGWVTGAGQAASDFVDGLVSGIAAGAGKVVGAVKGLASGATGAFKAALGISSPSRVMMQLGGHTGTGFAEGLESTEGEVHGAASGVAGAAVSGASGGGSPNASSGAKGIQVTFADGAIRIDGSGKSALEITEEMLAQVFARMALEAGV